MEENFEDNIALEVLKNHFTEEELIALRDILLSISTNASNKIVSYRKQLLSCVDLDEANTVQSIINMLYFNKDCVSKLFDFLGLGLGVTDED